MNKIGANTVVRVLLTLFVFSWISAGPVWAIDQESIDLNDRGMDYYYADEFIQAALFFLDAIDVDSSNYLAHFNLACTMCLIREKHGPCDVYGPNGEFDVRRTTILYHLNRSVALKESRREKLFTDSDLTCMHSTLAFHVLAGRSLSDPDDVADILPAVTWTVEQEGSNADIPSGVIDFFDDGSFEADIWGLQEPITGTGTYRLVAGEVLLDFDESNDSEGTAGGSGGTGNEGTPSTPLQLAMEDDRGMSLSLEDRQFLITNRLRECGD